MENRSTTGAGQQNARIVDRVRDRATAQLSNQKDRATDGLNSVAQAVRQSTQELRDQQHDTVAQYVERAAEQIQRFADGLKEKDVSTIARDAQRLARRQPALFIGGAFALGLVGARFLKSSPAGRGESSDVYRSDEYRFSESERQSFGRPTGAITGVPRDVPGTETF